MIIIQAMYGIIAGGTCIMQCNPFALGHRVTQISRVLCIHYHAWVLIISARVRKDKKLVLKSQIR